MPHKTVWRLPDSASPNLNTTSSQADPEINSAMTEKEVQK